MLSLSGLAVSHQAELSECELGPVNEVKVKRCSPYPGFRACLAIHAALRSRRCVLQHLDLDACGLGVDLEVH